MVLPRRPKFIEQYESVKLEISDLVKVSSLSVHRTQIYCSGFRRTFKKAKDRTKSAIDQRLKLVNATANPLPT